MAGAGTMISNMPRSAGEVLFFASFTLQGVQAGQIVAAGCSCRRQR